MNARGAIQRIDNPDVEVRAAIHAALETYNDAATGRPEPERWFAAFECTADGRPVGGAICVSYWDWVFVDVLHLPEQLRGRGGGTRVMRAVEREALRRGCRGVWLDTMSYQAPGFYRKLGFQEFARIPDWAPGLTRHSFRKTALIGWGDQGVCIVEDPPEAARAVVTDGLRAYNDSRVGAAKRTPVALVLHSDDGAIAGGLWGRMIRGWLVVELLVVPDGLRGRGIGTRLMAEAEAIARVEGASGVFLDTFSFQARPFYERLGFRVIGEIPDYPAPHLRFFLVKRLDGAAVLEEGAAAEWTGPV